MQSKPQNETYRHHHLPRFYLRGFSSPSKPSHTYVYKRDLPYDPIARPEFRNPSLRSIDKFAGMVENLYAVIKQGEVIDRDGYENQLGKRDSEDSVLLRKLLERVSLSHEEKLAFARFVLLMHSRSPKRLTEIKSITHRIIQRQGTQSSFLDAIEVWRSTLKRQRPANHADLLNLLDNVEARLTWRVVHHARSSVEEMGLEAMLTDLPASMQTLAKMDWHIFRAPNDRGFVASDVSVFLSTGIGNEHSEVIFPLDHAHVLVAAWTGGQAQFFEEATTETVESVNRLMAEQAQDNIFFCRSESAIADLLGASGNRRKDLPDE